jgi:hypothetical protein
MYKQIYAIQAVVDSQPIQAAALRVAVSDRQPRLTDFFLQPADTNSINMER